MSIALFLDMDLYLYHFEIIYLIRNKLNAYKELKSIEQILSFLFSHVPEIQFATR